MAYKAQDQFVLFIRHAQSEFNLGGLQYVQKHKLYGQCFDELTQDEGFNKAVSYNPKYFDAPISKQGYQQCKLAKQMFEPQNVKLVLVSPHQRTLQTCRQIFGDHKNVIVHPLVAEVFRYSCDVSSETERKIKEFPNYNFSEMKNWSDLWFVEVLTNKEKRDLCIAKINDSKALSFEQKQNIAIELLRQRKIEQKASELRQRVWKLKQLIKQLKQQHKVPNIAIVSHYHTTQCLLATDFDENGNTIGVGYIQNAIPYFRQLEDIMKIQ